jgi:hypothetical protein
MYAYVKTTLILPDELKAELVQTGIECRARQRPGNTAARLKAGSDVSGGNGCRRT